MIFATGTEDIFIAVFTAVPLVADDEVLNPKKVHPVVIVGAVDGVITFTVWLPLYAYPVAVGSLDEQPFLLNVTVTVFFHVATILTFPLISIVPLAAVPLVVVVVVPVPAFTHPLNVQLLNVYGFAGAVILQLVGLVALLYTVAIVQVAVVLFPVALLTFFCVVAVYWVPALSFFHI